MIETFFGQNTLDSSQAFLWSFLIGGVFGVALEQAGFGSSRRLAGIFYFRDMSVLRTMFTALITAMLGLGLCRQLGWIDDAQLYFMPTVYGAYVVAGLLFGVGFVVGGWCPGTAAVGLASGKTDALLFLCGTIVGTVLFNEIYSFVEPLYRLGDVGVRFLWQQAGMSRAGFGVLFTLVAVGMFWGSELLERRAVGAEGGRFLRGRFLRAFSVILVALAVGLWAAGAGQLPAPVHGAAAESDLLAAVEAGEEHIEPETLADRLMTGDASLLVVDIRLPAEYSAFHIQGAVNVQMGDLPAYLDPYRNRGTVVLYSNGMTHPAQARDALWRLGFQNVFILTDGLKGFLQRCLKPVSLRPEPLSPDAAARVRAWRRFFQGDAEPAGPGAVPDSQVAPEWPALVDTEWLFRNLQRPDVRILDCRPQPEYNGSHLPDSLHTDPEHFRSTVGGIGSMLLPARLLAEHCSLLGIRPNDTVVIVPGEKFHDATLVSMAFARLGHGRCGILDGGFARWRAENRTLTTALTQVTPSDYAQPAGTDEFTVDATTVLADATSRRALILDVRPADNFTGAKSDEPRGGHIPGARNRPYSLDVLSSKEAHGYRPRAELAAEYAAIIPSLDTAVIVHCRTGHQASQTFFLLRNLLGYRNVRWYDAGWSEWSARPELPAETGP